MEDYPFEEKELRHIYQKLEGHLPFSFGTGARVPTVRKPDTNSSERQVGKEKW